jgi:hypothetical protein
MMKLLVILTLVLFVTIQPIAHGADNVPATSDEPLLSEKASGILARMSDFISKVPAYSLISDTGHEVRQPNGHVLEYGSHLALTIRRPSQAIGRFESRNGDISIIVLEGKTLSVYGATDNTSFYDTTRQPGDIDSSLEFLANQVATPRQLRDFFSTDLTAFLASAVRSGYYVGESKISGVICDHLALRGDKEDVQVWIARGAEPVPRRIVITYRQIEGQPRFWAQFTEWNFSPELSDTTFTFSPPEGAERVRLFVEISGEKSK